MPKSDPAPLGSATPPLAAKPAPAPAPPAALDVPVELPPEPVLEHYLVLEDLPDLATVGRVLRATPARVAGWLDASAVRIATPREIEIAAPRFIVLED